MKSSAHSRKTDPNDRLVQAEMAGCGLLLSSGFSCLLFGFAVGGSMAPNAAVYGLRMAVFATIASLVIVAICLAAEVIRFRRKSLWYTTLRGESLDRLGGSYGVERKAFESDPRYRLRIQRIVEHQERTRGIGE